jgi:hypothetical protein
MQYQDLTEIAKAFITRGISTLDSNYSVGDVAYHFSTSSDFELVEMVKGQKYGYCAFAADATTENQEKLKSYKEQRDDPMEKFSPRPSDYLLFIWGVSKQSPSLAITPFATRFIPRHMIQNVNKWLTNESSEEWNDNILMEADVDDDNLPDPPALSKDRDVIHDTTNVQLVGFNENEAIEARVDTGAAQCCLHAENIRYSNETEQVEFDYNERRYRMALHGEQDIKSADGGVSKRPVVLFKVKVEGKLFEGIAFNLNDRSNMPHHILLGQNLLEQGNFLIDPIDKEDQDGEQETNESINVNAAIEAILENCKIEQDIFTDDET